MEGKEVRFGPVQSALLSVVTTVTSCGAVNSMHDSFMPLGGFVQMFDIQLGEVVFGGVGSGLYGMLIFVILAMFIAGLMVGRTPELYGKKIEPYEMTLTTIHILIPIFLILGLTAIAVLTVPGTSAVFNPGPHGFSEILYAFTEASQNNGSAFGGLSANSVFYNLATAFAMFVGRYAVAIITLALAGSFVVKKIVPVSDGTLRDHRPLFIVWLVFVVIIIGALTFPPGAFARACRRISYNDLPEVLSMSEQGSTKPREAICASTSGQSSTPSGNSIHGPCITNVVMFTVEIGSVITTLLLLQSLSGKGEASPGFIGAIAAWLWFTVLFANFAEALAEGRGKAQADSLRKMRRDTEAKKLYLGYEVVKGKEPAPADFAMVSSSTLRKSDLYYVKAGDTIPVDGEVVEGVASVNESAITGESAPVIRESGGDRSAVTGGTVILSDWLIIRASANPGEGFLDHMISLIEGAKRQKTPNEIALNILLIGLTAVFIVVCASLWAFSVYSVKAGGCRRPGHDHGARRPLRLPRPDNHRGTAQRDRHCRHGPADPAQCHHDIGPGYRGGGGRRCPPPRQDRDDHAWQPAGCRAETGRRDRYHGPCRDRPARIPC